MFDGEDALGQVATMSLDNQRSLKLAIHRDPLFLKVAGKCSGNEPVGEGLLRPRDDQRLAQAARLHHQDLPARAACTSTTATSAAPTATSASMTDMALFVTNNQKRPRDRRVDRPLPAENPDGRGGRALERHDHRTGASSRAAGWNGQGLRSRRAARNGLSVDGDSRGGPHFIGFNTGRWDYINSVADALAWDPSSSSIPTSTRSR